MSVCSYTNTTFLTHKRRSERPTEENDGVAPLSLSRERRDPATRATTKTGEGDSAPHEHAVAARPSTRPAGAASTRALRAESAPPTYHTSKRTHNKQPPKNNTRRERIAQAPTKDPVQHGLVDPSTPSRETRQQSRATKARSRRRVPTATHSVRPQKHERRAR